LHAEYRTHILPAGVRVDGQVGRLPADILQDPCTRGQSEITILITHDPNKTVTR
jgi:hypothetical protein